MISCKGSVCFCSVLRMSFLKKLQMICRLFPFHKKRERERSRENGKHHGEKVQWFHTSYDTNYIIAFLLAITTKRWWFIHRFDWLIGLASDYCLNQQHSCVCHSVYICHFYRVQTGLSLAMNDDNDCGWNAWLSCRDTAKERIYSAYKTRKMFWLMCGLFSTPIWHWWQSCSLLQNISQCSQWLTAHFFFPFLNCLINIYTKYHIILRLWAWINTFFFRHSTDRPNGRTFNTVN